MNPVMTPITKNVITALSIFTMGMYSTPYRFQESRFSIVVQENPGTADQEQQGDRPYEQTDLFFMNIEPTAYSLYGLPIRFFLFQENRPFSGPLKTAVNAAGQTICHGNVAILLGLRGVVLPVQAMP
jgi:hypothetical protein